MVWYSHLLKNFLQFVVIHTVKSFCIVNEAEVDVFLEFPCFLYDPTNTGNLISGSSAFSKPNLYNWKFSVQLLLKSSLKDFEHNLASMRNAELDEPQAGIKIAGRNINNHRCPDDTTLWQKKKKN